MCGNSLFMVALFDDRDGEKKVGRLKWWGELLFGHLILSKLIKGIYCLSYSTKGQIEIIGHEFKVRWINLVTAVSVLKRNRTNSICKNIYLYLYPSIVYIPNRIYDFCKLLIGYSHIYKRVCAQASLVAQCSYICVHLCICIYTHIHIWERDRERKIEWKKKERESKGKETNYKEVTHMIIQAPDLQLASWRPKRPDSVNSSLRLKF